MSAIILSSHLTIMKSWIRYAFYKVIYLDAVLTLIWLDNTVRCWMTLQWSSASGPLMFWCSDAELLLVWTQHKHWSIATSKLQTKLFHLFLTWRDFSPSCQSDTLTEKMCSLFPSTMFQSKCGWRISCFKCSTEWSTPQPFYTAAEHLLFSIRCWYYLFTFRVSQSERSSNTQCNRTRRSTPREREAQAEEEREARKASRERDKDRRENTPS